MAATPNNRHTNPETEEISRSNRQRFHTLIENEREIIALLNNEGIVTSISPSILSLLGYPPEEIIGCRLSAFAHPDDRDTLQQAIVITQQAYGKSLGIAYRLYCRDGTLRWFEGSITNLFHTPGVGALVGTFRTVSTRELAPGLSWSKIDASEHFVLFYEMDEFLLDSLSDFIRTGLNEGDSCIIIATKDHRERLEERLRVDRLDLTAAHMQNKYISLDAAETLSKFMVDGLPDPKRFVEVIGSLIMQAAQDQHHVRIFGEMVDLLWTEENQAAAIRMEELWLDACLCTGRLQRAVYRDLPATLPGYPR